MSKTVLITGASSGIGKQTALWFQKRGWNVVATMRSPETATELSQLDRVLCLKLDVTDINSITLALEQAIAEFGRIDVLVNNAGYGLAGVFEASTIEQVKRQFATNVFGLMDVTRSLLPHFRQHKGGVIVNVASVGGRVAFPLLSLYHSTKWAVEGFSESLQHELKPLNIRVKIIEPGPIKTDFYDRSLDLITNPDITAYDPIIATVSPNMNRLGQTGYPAELVAKTIYEASTDNSWRLRYPVGGAAPLLFLRKLLPDRLFTLIIEQIMLAK
ncbi:short-chain alcohol dehydrogenase [Synechococcus sp. PCC 7502]|uniref:SDR family oxidoreductase n=1 Tax=Synechococcus sp. PCC 7502 TaxID=1173263 RepID=UPI00029F9442|nr:SDR family oxidoreductase [Synechococcus sp. PCC 7502]AFY72428.1 short-chain alcohol dehydrogenase [Synechococcus sp. PCC 7502]